METASWVINVGWMASVVLAAAMVLLCGYALHSLWLLQLYRRSRVAAGLQERAELLAELPPPDRLPRVLVQLPVYNERDVVARLIDAAGVLDWPAERLLIQVLDDSDDDTSARVATLVDRWTRAGVPMEHLRRPLRAGFKAGALDHGLARAECDFVAIFDADFVPPADFLRRAIRPLLDDPGLAVVQGRWDHINPRQNCLTRAQAVGLDGHFMIEQAARAWNGLPMHFNGTCGMWRRAAIEAAGGWQHDTLTEDIDLSYRAQLAGYRCTYRNYLAVPGELPASIDAWRAQQFRWAKGSIQVAAKLLPRLLRSSRPLSWRLAAVLHLTHYVVNPVVALSLLMLPLVLWLTPQRPPGLLALGLAAIVLGLSASAALYLTSQRCLRRRPWRACLADYPLIAALGSGLALSNSRAVWEALSGRPGIFVRTPKSGAGHGSYRANTHSGAPEWLAAAWAVWGQCKGLSLFTPLLLVYASGFAWVGLLSLRSWWRARGLPP